MRRAAKIDSNQNEVVDALRELPNISVAITSALGKGFVDIVVGVRRGSDKRNYLIELKDGKKVKSKRKLTPEEEKFHAEWVGQIDVAESLEDVIKIIGF